GESYAQRIQAAPTAIDRSDSCNRHRRSLLIDLVALTGAARYDSALALLDQLYYSGGGGPAITQLRILLNIAAGTFTEDLYGREIIEELVEYRHRCFDGTDGLRGHWRKPEDNLYREFVRRLARRLIGQAGDAPLEQLFCECYAECCDSFFVRLRSPKYAQTQMRRYYQMAMTRALGADYKKRGLSFINWAAYTGHWFPLGRNRQLDNHPTFGGLFGFIVKKISFELTGELRMFPARNAFTLTRQLGIDTARTFLGSSFALEFGHEIMRTSRYRIDLRAGFGYDGFSYKPDTVDVFTSAASFATSFGLGYMYFPKEHSGLYFGVQAMLSRVAYQRAVAAELGDYAMSLRLTAGRFGNTRYHSKLRDLDY
ncbi:MAG: hypothetical protein ACE5GA_10650, partial [Candidatus Zixiibacteriota bacterium]